MGSVGNKKGVSIFRAEAAPELDQTDFMRPPVMSEETGESVVANMANGALTGSKLKVLVRQTDEEGGFSLVHVWFKPNYPLPRHSHDADCMYYVISGSLQMGSQTLQAGDCFYVPSEAPYLYSAGPTGVEVLEIRRGAESFDIKIFDASPERWEAMLRTLQTHRDEWEGMETSPTFAGR
jgi:mannose-6-phosphate isomerase-like protein (cupin superfamily)